MKNNKQTVKLNENKLNKLIKESIVNVLSEAGFNRRNDGDLFGDPYTEGNDFDDDLNLVKPNMMLDKSKMRHHNGFDEYINANVGQDSNIAYYVCPFKTALTIIQYNAFSQQFARQQAYGMGVYAFIDKETAMRNGRNYGDTVIAVKIAGPGAKVHEEMGVVVIPYKIAKPIAMMTFKQLPDFPGR